MDAVGAKKLSNPLTAWHCCLEFFSVMTRLPPEFRLSPQDAYTLLIEEILARFKVVDLLAAHRSEFLQTLTTENISGGRVYDAHIAEVARRQGVGIVITENRKHFMNLLRYGTQVLTAEQAVQDLL